MSTELKIIIIGGILTIIAIVLVSILITGNTPSSVNSNLNKENIVAANGLHWHPKLSVYIKGEKFELTDGIGLGAVHQKLHTHTEDFAQGVVHMEIPGVVTKEDTKLGNFFKIWGKEFSSTQIFDKKNGSEGKVKMTVNGEENTDFEKYAMRDGDIIEIRYE